MEEILTKTGMKKIIVGCELTGCYWLIFQKFPLGYNILLATVNPYSVNRSEELDDNNLEKSDLKYSKAIAGQKITKISSGEEERPLGISKKCRWKQRNTMYESARALINWNAAFLDVFLYCRNRTKRPLGRM